MNKPLDLSANAPWKQRFNAPRFLLAYMARANPAHGIVIGNQVKSYQVYVWETASGELRLLTDRSSPTNRGWISPDGLYVYFLDDQSGNGGPHVVRTNYFRQTSQAWLDHGFAYCALNYRGSITFGRAFKEQIWGDTET